MPDRTASAAVIELSSTLRALPGPLDHLDEITASLDDGLTCLWLVPDTLVSSGIADQMIDDLADRPRSIRMPPPKTEVQEFSPAAEYRPAETPPSTDTQRPAWARDVFGLMTDDHTAVAVSLTTEPATLPQTVRSLAERLADLLDWPVQPGSDPIRELVGSPETRDSVIVVRAWEELDPTNTADLLVRLPAVVKELGVAPGERPRLLMAARLDDLPAGVLGQLDSVTTAVFWYWGVMGRLDTAVTVALERSRRGRHRPVRHPVREQVLREVIVEVAGPDLGLASSLAATWDGRFATLPAELPGYCGETEQVEVASQRHGATRPPARLLPIWAQGLVQLWDGQVHADYAIIADHLRDVDLHTKLWRGQNRGLATVIDEYRGWFENIVRSRASMSLLAELTGSEREDYRMDHHDVPDPRRSVLELGPMAWAVGTGRIRIPRADLLFCLRDIRNMLAHLRPVPDDDLDRLIQLLPTSV
jgi:hypothetical protein